jgi:hypothetical protein
MAINSSLHLDTRSLLELTQKYFFSPSKSKSASMLSLSCAAHILPGEMKAQKRAAAAQNRNLGEFNTIT